VARPPGLLAMELGHRRCCSRKLDGHANHRSMMSLTRSLMEQPDTALTYGPCDGILRDGSQNKPAAARCMQILYEETLFQKLEDGTPLVKQLQDKGVLLGIKVDKGVQPLFGTDGETTVQVRGFVLRV
jgi:Fructose-bisphosphate aldolase class-I